MELQPGEETEVIINLDHRAFAFFVPSQNGWVVEDGEFEILVGASSRDIRLASIISITSLQKITPEIDNKNILPYINLSKNTAISSEAFIALYGKPLPENIAPKKGNYTVNTPIGDMSDSLIGRMLYKMMNQQVKRMFKSSAEENPLLDMIDSMLKEMPLRSLVMMSNGAISSASLEGLLLMIIGKFFKGLAALVKTDKVK